MRIGIQLPEVERSVRWPGVAAMATAAEEAGFDSVWVGDHLLYRGDGRPERGPWEAWTQLAALAAVTERVTLGPLVACLGFHPPAVLAKMAATVDEVSGGRLVLGVGSGWNWEEFRAFGLPSDRTVSRFADAFAIVRPLVAGERVTHAGAYWSAEDAVLLPQPRRPIPIMVGSTGPRTLALTLPWAASWNTWWLEIGNAPEGFAAASAKVTAACGDADRDPAEVERTVCVFVVLDRSAPERPIVPEAPPLEGSPARIAARLREFADAGADEAILVVSPITEASVRALGDVVTELR